MAPQPLYLGDARRQALGLTVVWARELSNLFGREVVVLAKVPIHINRYLEHDALGSGQAITPSMCSIAPPSGSVMDCGRCAGDSQRIFGSDIS